MKRTSATLALILAASAAWAGLAIAEDTAAQDGFRTHFMESWDGDADGKVTLEEARARRTDIFAAFDADEDGFLTDPELAQMDEMRANEHEGMEGGHGGGMGHGKGDGKGQGMGQGMGQGHGKGQGQGKGHGKMGQFQMTAEAGLHDRKGIDANGDGKIAKEEFIGMTEGWFARLDRNSDGAIDGTDF